MNKRSKGISIAVKLALGAILLVIVSISVTSYVAIRQQTEELESAAQRSADLLATAVSLMFAEDLAMNNYASLQNTIPRLRKQNPSVLLISIVDRDGQLVASDAATGGGAKMEPMSRNIEFARQVFGRIDIIFDRSPIDDAKDEILATTFTVSLTLLGVAFVLAFAWANIFSKPIVELAGAAERVAEGDLSLQVPVHSRDEVGRLSERFNEMVSNLARSRAALEKTLNELSTLYSVSKIINTTSDMDEILKLNIETLSTGFNFAPVAILIETEHEWRVAAIQRSAGGHAVNPKSGALDLASIGLASAVGAHESITVDPTGFPAEWEIPATGVPVFATPLRSGNHLVGILIATGAGAREKDAEKILSVVASQIAPPILISIMQARAFRQVSNPFEYIAQRVEDALAKAREFSVGVAVFVFKYDQKVWADGAVAVEHRFEELEKAVSAAIPDTSLAVRYGVNRLIAVVPGYSRKEARAAAMQLDLPDGDSIGIGFVCFPDDGESAHVLLSKAEEAAGA